MKQNLKFISFLILLVSYPVEIVLAAETNYFQYKHLQLSQKEDPQIGLFCGIRNKEYKFKIQLNAEFSPIVEDRAKDFTSSDLSRISDSLESSYNYPYVIYGHGHLAIKHNDYFFELNRNYYAQFELYDPTFPKMDMNSFYDNQFIVGVDKKFSDQDQFIFELIRTKRNYFEKTYSITEVIEDDIDIDIEEGKEHLNYKFNAQLVRKVNDSITVYTQANAVPIAGEDRYIYSELRLGSEVKVYNKEHLQVDFIINFSPWYEYTYDMDDTLNIGSSFRFYGLKVLLARIGRYDDLIQYSLSYKGIDISYSKFTLTDSEIPGIRSEQQMFSFSYNYY